MPQVHYRDIHDLCQRNEHAYEALTHHHCNGHKNRASEVYQTDHNIVKDAHTLYICQMGGACPNFHLCGQTPLKGNLRTHLIGCMKGWYGLDVVVVHGQQGGVPYDQAPLSDHPIPAAPPGATAQTTIHISVRFLCMDI